MDSKITAEFHESLLVSQREELIEVGDGIMYMSTSGADTVMPVTL